MNTTTTTTAAITHTLAKGMPFSEGTFILIIFVVLGIVAGFIIINTIRKKNIKKPSPALHGKLPKDKTLRSNEPSEPDWAKNLNKKLDDLHRQLNPNEPEPSPQPEIVPEQPKPVESWSRQGDINAEIEIRRNGLSDFTTLS